MIVHIKTVSVPNMGWEGYVRFLCGAIVRFVEHKESWVTEAEALERPHFVTCEDCQTAHGIHELRKLA
jgi:hypothetical protein